MHLADVAWEFQESFLRQYGPRLLPSHRKALSAILACRTAAAGSLVVRCPTCDTLEWRAHSCGHRSCPRCQHHEAEVWLARQREKLLPVPVFLVTFTVPASLRPLAWCHQRTFYSCLFEAASSAVQTMAKDPKYLGADVGMTGVLHTNNRRLDFHPHVHFLVPSGGVDPGARMWKRTRGRFLFPQRAVSRLFRGRLVALLRGKGLAVPKVFSRGDWVVHCKRVGSGETALTYLGRYLYRGVISERRILRCADGQVTFAYRDSGTGRYRKRTMPGERFLWTVLRHVLPRGFRRARDYGFLHGNARRTLRLVQLLLRAKPSGNLQELVARPPFRCQVCGIAMEILARFDPKDSGGPSPPKR